MSVLKSDRSTSPVQFLESARQLEVYTLRMSTKLPKRYLYLHTVILTNLSHEIYNKCKMANSVFPTNAHEVQLRRDYFIQAYSSTQALSSQLEITCEMFTDVSITQSEWINWIKLVNDCCKYIVAIMKSDCNRYSSLK